MQFRYLEETLLQHNVPIAITRDTVILKPPGLSVAKQKPLPFGSNVIRLSATVSEGQSLGLAEATNTRLILVLSIYLRGALPWT